MLPWARLLEQHSLNQIFADAYSVSLFVTDWGDESADKRGGGAASNGVGGGAKQVWFKRRVPTRGRTLHASDVEVCAEAACAEMSAR